MTYKIDVRHENAVFISFFGTTILRGDEFEQYLRDVIDLNVMFDRAGHAQAYHILIVESFQLDFEGILWALTTMRQNKDMVAVQSRLQIVSMIVTPSPATAQFLETMLSNSGYKGRRLSVFPTIEAALAFIRFEQASLSNQASATG